MAKIRIDLTEPRLEQSIQRRFQLLTALSDELLADGFLDRTEIVLRDDQLARSVEAYYLLSEAYEVERSGHRADDVEFTRNPRRAGLMAASLMVFRPFRIIDPSQPVRKELSSIANQTLAMEFAGSVLKQDFTFLTTSMQQRLFRFLQLVELSCLSEYVADEKAVALKSVYEIDLAPDMATLDTLILLFELMPPRA